MIHNGTQVLAHIVRDIAASKLICGNPLCQFRNVCVCGTMALPARAKTALCEWTLTADQERVQELEQAIREHQGKKGADRNQEMDLELYRLVDKTLTCDTRLPSKVEYLARCEELWENRQSITDQQATTKIESVRQAARTGICTDITNALSNINIMLGTKCQTVEEFGFLINWVVARIQEIVQVMEDIKAL